MKKIILSFLCIALLLTGGAGSAFAQSAKIKQIKSQEELIDENLDFFISDTMRARAEYVESYDEDGDEEFVRMHKEDYLAMRALAARSKSITQRVKDIEGGVRKLQRFTSFADKALKFLLKGFELVTKFLNFILPGDLKAPDPIDGGSPNDDGTITDDNGTLVNRCVYRDHGYVMEPCFVTFRVVVNQDTTSPVVAGLRKRLGGKNKATINPNERLTFFHLGKDAIDIDFITNAQAVGLAGIKGENVNGDAITRINLSRSKSGSTIRAQIPILNQHVSELVFHALFKSNKEINIRNGSYPVGAKYYKRLTIEDGRKVAPYRFEGPTGNKSVKVKLL